ncbi:MAG: hypothetical protein K0U66_07700 [Gammaproteobacteria bacterium]|nr:hypothetical protein [Pseudomonadota bacterium]MCH9663523.1 hypothetical protein [Gammaproteobacteria bacterium]
MKFTTRIIRQGRRTLLLTLTAVGLLSSHVAHAEIDWARLTSGGQKYYNRDFTIGGRVDFESDYLLYSQPHPLKRNTAVAIAALDITWAGVSLEQSVTYLKDEYEYLARIEYNHLWSSWDIRLMVQSRIHLRDRVENFIEYGLASGVRLGEHRLALQILHIEGNSPHLATELLYEVHLHGVFYWQNLVGAEQGRLQLLQDEATDTEPERSAGQIWLPYFKTIGMMDFHTDETWSAVFEIGAYIHRNRLNGKAKFTFLWGIRLNF